MKRTKNLKTVKDLGVILKLLNGAKDKNSEVYVWKLVGDIKHIGKVRIECIRKSRKEFAITPLEGQKKIVESIIDLNSAIDIYIPDSCLLFRASIKLSDSTRYFIEFPSFVAQIDRRKSFRLTLGPSSCVNLTFSKGLDSFKDRLSHFRKDCYDISSGGFSFHISRLEMRYFKESDQFDVILNLEKKEIRVKAKITLVSEIQPDEFNDLSYKVWRVGCNFQNIDELSRKYIDNYIFERIKDELHVINE